MAAGLLLAAAGVLAFRRAGTTSNPLKPEAARGMVITGPYRWSRNPMYLGFLTALIGWGMLLETVWVWIGPALWWAFITRFQNIPEERWMREKFGEEFVRYREEAGRWLRLPWPAQRTATSAHGWRRVE